MYGDLDAIPVFAKAGAIVPLGPQVGWGGVGNPEKLTLHVFAGADNRFALYEDDGETTRYQHGHHALTMFEQRWGQNRLDFTVAPVIGEMALAPALRTVELVILGVVQPDQVTLTLNGQPLPSFAMHYDAQAKTLMVDAGVLSRLTRCI